MPIASKTTQDMVKSIVLFKGPDEIKKLYSDRGPEIIAAAKELNTAHCKSIAYSPKDNSIAEARVRMSKEGIRTVMATSGMPHKWWPYAAEYYSFAKNTLVVEGDSPYSRRLKRGHCQALRIPF